VLVFFQHKIFLYSLVFFLTKKCVCLCLNPAYKFIFKSYIKKAQKRAKKEIAPLQHLLALIQRTSQLNLSIMQYFKHKKSDYTIEMGRGKHCTEEKRDIIQKLIKDGKSYRVVGRLVGSINQNFSKSA